MTFISSRREIVLVWFVCKRFVCLLVRSRHDEAFRIDRESFCDDSTKYWDTIGLKSRSLAGHSREGLATPSSECR